MRLRRPDLVVPSRPACAVAFDLAFGRMLEVRAAQAARWLTGRRAWEQGAAAMIAGAVSILAMAPFFLWPVLLATLPVLHWLIVAAPDPRRAALAGWCFGFGYFVPGLYWLREAFAVTGGPIELLWPLAVVGLPAFLAMFMAAAATAAFAVRGPALIRLLALAVALSATEWLRGHIFTGFPWNVLGYALTYPLVLMQSASLLGIYGLTLLAVPMLAGPAVLLADGRSGACRWPPWLQAAAIFIVPLALMLAFGAWRLSAEPPRDVAGVKFRLVQPSIPQRDKWLASAQAGIFQRHLALSRQRADGSLDDLAGITHVVWPEAAMPFLPLGHPDALAAIGELLPPGTHLLAGIMRSERVQGGLGQYQVFNSLAAFDDAGRPAAIYDKIHLVPYGEYLPFRPLLEAIGLETLTRQRGGFAMGQGPRRPLAVPGLPPVGVLICYEGIFPGAVVQSPERPGVLLHVTNDGWFGNSTGPRQHQHQARLRAVEEGLPLIRVANNGISALYDAYGRERARLDLDVAGVIDTGLPGAISPPIYARFGDNVFLLLLSASVATLLFRRAVTGCDASHV